MSKAIKIQSVFREYQVDFTSDIKKTLKDFIELGDVFILDAKLASIYPHLTTVVPKENLWLVEPEEASKSYEGVIGLIDSLISKGFRRNHRLFAIGGGITQDVTAFVASMLYRGVEWVFIPTNILSQCDSCIGSKTSINFRQYKNQLGGFFPPSQIFIDTTFVKTLGDWEIRSGLGEMLHYFAVTSSEDVTKFKEQAPRLLSREINLEEMMFRSLEIKRNMIQADEFDKGPRNIFNYGHSFGHALESAIRYQLPHGICVAFGIDLANLVSEHLGLIDRSTRNRIREACAIVYKGIEIPKFEIGDYYEALSRDKKNKGAMLGLIVTEGEGVMYKKFCEFSPEIKRIIFDFFDQKLYLKE